MVFLRLVTHLHKARNEERKALFDHLPKRRLKPYNSSRPPSKPVLQHRGSGHFLEFLHRGTYPLKQAVWTFWRPQIGSLPRCGAGSTGQRNTRPKSFNRNVLAMRAARGLPTSGSH